jgi:hypothetical protein
LNDIKIKKLMADNQELHSDFQIDNFIIGNQGDRWAQYKQCLREISGRRENIRLKKSEAELLRLDIDRKKIYWPSRYGRKKAKIKRQEKLKRFEDLRAIISEYERELSRFLKHALELKRHFGNINRERRQQLELESWTAKGRKMAAIDRVLTGRISHQTFEFILSLPIESQHSILDKILPDDVQARLLIEDLRG